MGFMGRDGEALELGRRSQTTVEYRTDTISLRVKTLFHTGRGLTRMMELGRSHRDCIHHC
jgi:hypothetical protein